MKKIHLITLAMAAMMLCPMTTMAQKKQKKEKAQTQVVQRDTVEVLTERAQKGDDKAQNTLGSWYYTGTRVKQDYETAASYYAQGVDSGDLTSYYYLGLLYKQGLGVEQDYGKAAELFSSVAASDNKSATGASMRMSINKRRTAMCSPSYMPDT